MSRKNSGSQMAVGSQIVGGVAVLVAGLTVIGGLVAMSGDNPLGIVAFVGGGIGILLGVIINQLGCLDETIGHGYQPQTKTPPPKTGRPGHSAIVRPEK